MSEKMCELYDRKCINCGECDRCDLDPADDPGTGSNGCLLHRYDRCPTDAAFAAFAAIKGASGYSSVGHNKRSIPALKHSISLFNWLQ